MRHAPQTGPRLLRHRRSGRAFTVLRGQHGRRRQVTLGAWTDAGRSPQAQRVDRELLVRWHAQKIDPSAAALAIEEATCLEIEMLGDGSV